LGQDQTGKRLYVDIEIPDAHLLQEKRICNLRIVKKNKIVTAVFTIEEVVPESKAVRKIIALDPNHKNLAYGVNNLGIAVEIESPLWLKKFDKRLDELRSKRDRCKRKAKEIQVLDENGHYTGKVYWQASRRYRKFCHVLDCVYAKRQEQTKVYCYTVANKLVQEHDLVVVGDYVPHGGGLTTKMRRAMNNRSLIGRFKDTLAWVALKSGKAYGEFNEKGTTRTCHACRHVVVGGLEPSIRQWTCAGCRRTHLRDENSAINGMYKFLWELEKSGGHTLPVPSSGLVVVKQRWAWRVKPSGIVAIPRGRNCALSTNAKKLNRMRGSVLSEFAHDQV
jgi:putative transposase